LFNLSFSVVGSQVCLYVKLNGFRLGLETGNFKCHTWTWYGVVSLAGYNNLFRWVTWSYLNHLMIYLHYLTIFYLAPYCSALYCSNIALAFWMFLFSFSSLPISCFITPFVSSRLLTRLSFPGLCLFTGLLGSYVSKYLTPHFIFVIGSLLGSLLIYGSIFGCLLMISAGIPQVFTFFSR